MRISVIIPAYNAADTIVPCLESVVNGADEVVVVDDGSTDGTADVVRKAFPEVIVLQQQNQGVSAARNAGMDAATGDYFAFVDADDRLFPNALPEAAACAGETEPDLLVLRILSDSGEHYPWRGRFRSVRDYDKTDIVEEGYMRGSACGCLFKRDYIRRLSLRFPEGISMAEDTLFFNAAVAGGGRIRFGEIPFYHVIERPGSASRNYDDAFFKRLSAALFRAPEMIPDEALCTQIRMSIILSITSHAIQQHRSPKWTREITGLDQARPLPLHGLKKGRMTVRLLNASYPLFYRIVQIKDSLKAHG
ncbi:MAG: glycosyltransferase family 2 protein [Bacteroidales bacterium]|nr:glycosyltransferase family 2 protein [Bacteroidales bacterium]